MKLGKRNIPLNHKTVQRLMKELDLVYCLDNAVIENFFGLPKGELPYLQEFNSMEHFKQELLEYLDCCSNRRVKAKLKGLPPALHRQQALSAA